MAEIELRTLFFRVPRADWGGHAYFFETPDGGEPRAWP